MLRLTFSDRKICSTIKKFQDIINMIVAHSVKVFICTQNRYLQNAFIHSPKKEVSKIGYILASEIEIENSYTKQKKAFYCC